MVSKNEALGLIYKIGTGSFGSMDLEREAIAEVIRFIAFPMVENEVFDNDELEDFSAALTQLGTGTFTTKLQRELIAELLVEIIEGLRRIPQPTGSDEPEELEELEEPKE